MYAADHTPPDIQHHLSKTLHGTPRRRTSLDSLSIEREGLVGGTRDVSLAPGRLGSGDGDDVGVDGTVESEGSEEGLHDVTNNTTDVQSISPLIHDMPTNHDMALTLVSASTSKPVSPTSKAETSGTYWSFLSRSSSCNRKEIPRTGPF